jgi:hypothetical protein
VLNDATNIFGGTVGITSAKDVTLVDSTALDLAASTISGELNLTASGNITQSGVLNVTGNATFAACASNDVVLNDATNIFGGTLGITSANNVTLVDSTAIDLAASTISGELSVGLRLKVASQVFDFVVEPVQDRIPRDRRGLLAAHDAPRDFARAALCDLFRESQTMPRIAV